MTQIIVVTRRSNDFHAALESDHRIWGCGVNRIEAIGDLVTAHPEEFNISGFLDQGAGATK